MRGSFLLTRPNHEQTTKYLFEWAKEVIQKANEKNFLMIDLAGSLAKKVNFTKAVKKYSASFIYLNGHGSPNEVTGYNNEPLLKFADNEKLTKDRVVYALSCQSAKRLGKSCVSDGAKAYLGYKEDFIFVFDEEKQNSPIEDKVAENFLQPSNDLAISIIEGKTINEAFENSQESFTQKIVKYSLSEAAPEERELLPYLLWDRENQVLLGDKQVKCKFLTQEEYAQSQQKKKLIVVLIISAVLLGIVLFFLLKR